MILDPQAVRLAQWFAGLQDRVDKLVDDRLHGACAQQLEQVSATLQAAAQVAGPPALTPATLQPPPGTTTGLLADADASALTNTSPGEDDSLYLAFLGPEARPRRTNLHSEPLPARPPEARGWKSALEQDIRPALHRARGTLRASGAAFRDGSALASLRDEIDATLARQPEQLDLDIHPEDSTIAATLPVAHVEVPLRRWLRETLQPALQTTLIDFSARIATAVDGATSELERIETVLDYHLFIVEDGRVAEHRDESARTGLGHGVRLVQQLAERLDRDVARIYRWFIATSADHMDDALAPLRAHRPEEISQALAARAQRAQPSWWSGTSLGALARNTRELYGKATPLVRELVQDLRGVLRDDQPRLGYWDLAIASDAIPDDRLPALYRRLFGEIPLGLADLYQPRRKLELACRRVFETWLSGQPRRGERAALLVVGDRGAGKRTLVNRVRAELHGELPVRWLPLGPHLASEPRLCAGVCEATGAAPAESFHELAQALRALGQRQAIVLENSEQLFLRTPEGLARVQSFLDLIRATDDAILWIVLMVKPTAALLDTCLRLPLYFGEVVRLEPESATFLEGMVRARHRVSGFGLRFRARRAPVLQRLRAPFTRSDLLPDPGEEWFAQLGRMTGGNLQQALQFWQIAARIDAQTHTEIVVRPLPRRRGGALTQLSLAQRLVLATLVQHGALTEAQILATLRLLGHGAAPEIDDLLRRKLVEPCPHADGHLQLRNAAVGPVTLDLRWRNML
ncbi:hypothetical protein [Nannocystis sp.]|uniref:hypothetical protein n=1 Tax=Nannocystis sp. TaxID=1962667 RepID=UPI002425BC36|nr:hypothetical protein [Nannocystis sp.]MBK7830133.1 hypothetical protein [Nannocystis sp.]MBK9752114.1 hypothetical protein [Nannocystis sp.]